MQFQMLVSKEHLWAYMDIVAVGLAPCLLFVIFSFWLLSVLVVLLFLLFSINASSAHCNLLFQRTSLEVGMLCLQEVCSTTLLLLCFGSICLMFLQPVCHRVASLQVGHMVANRLFTVLGDLDFRWKNLLEQRCGLTNKHACNEASKLSRGSLTYDLCQVAFTCSPSFCNPFFLVEHVERTPDEPQGSAPQIEGGLHQFGRGLAAGNLHVLQQESL